MKRIYKSCVAVLLLLAMLLSCVPALAAGSSHSYTTLQKAEALKTLGLFQGTNKGFELEKTLTREQAITLIVRLLGAEAEAKEKNPEHPFTDVLAWASPYVGYGYQNALVKGVSETLFGYGKLVTEAQFLTMVLRLLQYEDDTDFTWNKSAELAEKLGLPVVPANSGEYTRGNAVDVIWALLETKFKSGGKTLAQTLIEKGVFTEKAYDAVSLLEKMNVRVLCTTDDPADTLEWHKKIAADPTIPFRVLPSFRPDNYLGGNPDAECALCEKYGTGSLPEALGKALDYFCENGCKVSDHGFSKFSYVPGTKQAELLHFLGKAYHAHGVAMQLHLGPIRNQNPRLMAEIGPDAGGDSVGLTTDPFQLGAFLGKLEREGCLPNTILYNLNPTDNAMLATMAVNFAPKVQFGAAWWFNDTIRGMRRQIDELMENGLLAKSVGMLTDSRSFSSFPRHEYSPTPPTG